MIASHACKLGSPHALASSTLSRIASFAFISLVINYFPAFVKPLWEIFRQSSGGLGAVLRGEGERVEIGVESVDRYALLVYVARNRNGKIGCKALRVDGIIIG